MAQSSPNINDPLIDTVKAQYETDAIAKHILESGHKQYIVGDGIVDNPRKGCFWYGQLLILDREIAPSLLS